MNRAGGATSIRFLLADDHPVVRRGLISMLAEEWPDGEFIEAADATELRERSLSPQDWDLILLDLSMPGSDGLEVLKDLKHRIPHVPVLVVSVHGEETYAIRTLRAGASGYINKAAAPRELLEAARKVLSGGRYISPSLAEALAFSVGPVAQDRSPHELLSEREFQVFCGIVSGKSTSEIAGELSLSAKTVSTYRHRVLEKTGLKTNIELVEYARHHHFSEKFL